MKKTLKKDKGNSVRSGVLIFPHQLFEKHPCLEALNGQGSAQEKEALNFKGKVSLNFYLIEPKLFFTQFKFHKQKLLLHRASMKAYAYFLEEKGHRVHYVNFDQQWPDLEEVFLCELSDDWLEKQVRKKYKQCHFLQGPDFFHAHRVERKDASKHKAGVSPLYKMASFYQAQRRQLDVLVDEKGKPLHGKWSFDEDNRKKLPKGHIAPDLPQLELNEFEKGILKEARDYVEKNFSKHPGSLNFESGLLYEEGGSQKQTLDIEDKKSSFMWPFNHRLAKKAFKLFLKERFHLFGDYEDAISLSQGTLYHSLLSSSINCGLLSPQYVLEGALAYASEEKALSETGEKQTSGQGSNLLEGSNLVGFNSLEGFVRQIIGWREFVREVYLLEGSVQRRGNFWKHKRKIPRSFWIGETGVLPVDTAIKRMLGSAYNHHIERLMILGNFMLLCEFDPDEVYEWFMTFYIDAYDWVMVLNVYGMSQYADGGLMTTKPYISSSNYVRKMSDFPKGEWCEIWDGLYWRFIQKHRDFFEKNPRLSVMTLALRRMKKEKLDAHLNVAESFLKSLT